MQKMNYSYLFRLLLHLSAGNDRIAVDSKISRMEGMYMDYAGKSKWSGIVHVTWCVLAIVYFLMMYALIQGGVLLPETTGSAKDNFGTALGFGIAMALFLLFYAIGVGAGLIEGIVHAVVAFLHAANKSTGKGWWLYLSLLVKSLVVADCLFLTYLLYTSLGHLSFALLLVTVAPAILLAVGELFLFVLDLILKGTKEQGHLMESPTESCL